MRDGHIISTMFISFLSINTLSKPLGGSSRPLGDENEGIGSLEGIKLKFFSLFLNVTFGF